MTKEKLICHVCGREKKPYTVFMNTDTMSMITYMQAREKGEICERCDRYYAMTDIFKDATKEEFEIAEKACWFSRMMLKWWEKDKKMDDESGHNMREWPGMLSIMKWENNDFKNHNEMVEFFELMGKWWERDTPIHEKPEYNPREWVGTHFIRDWCRKELAK